MILRYSLFLLAIAFLGQSCTKKIAARQQKEAVVVPPTTITEEIKEVIKDPEIVAPEEEVVQVILHFQKSACYGKCPVFDVKVYSDGRVLYRGEANVEKMGFYETEIDTSQLDLLFSESERAAFFTLRSHYPTNNQKITDLPQTVTYLKRGELERRVINHFEAPLSLQHFEKFLEKFFEQLAWQKLSNQ